MGPHRSWFSLLSPLMFLLTRTRMLTVARFQRCNCSSDNVIRCTYTLYDYKPRQGPIQDSYCGLPICLLLRGKFVKRRVQRLVNSRKLLLRYKCLVWRLY